MTSDEADVRMQKFTALLQETLYAQPVLTPHPSKTITSEFMLDTTYAFFKHNLNYFVENSFELQRLIAQLPSAKLRRRFLKKIERNHELGMSPV